MMQDTGGRERMSTEFLMYVLILAPKSCFCAYNLATIRYFFYCALKYCSDNYWPATELEVYDLYVIKAVLQIIIITTDTQLKARGTIGGTHLLFFW
jgi:hypothetical protein